MRNAYSHNFRPILDDVVPGTWLNGRLKIPFQPLVSLVLSGVAIVGRHPALSAVLFAAQHSFPPQAQRVATVGLFSKFIASGVKSPSLFEENLR